MTKETVMKKTCAILLILLSGIVEAKPIKVLLFYPRNENFWNRMVLFAEEAASDLKIEIESINGNDNHIHMINTLKQKLKSDKPDVFVFNNYKSTASRFIEMTHEAKTHAFLINSDLQMEMKQKMGSPRTLYPYWIGQMLPGEEKAGMKVAEILFNHANTVLAINGVHQTGAAIMRESALKKALENKKVDLKQVLYTNKWARKPAAILTERAFRRYPKIQGIWAANYSLALGVVDCIQKMGLKPGKDIYVSGYDIPVEVLQNIKNGKILVTTGGHFIEAAWAMVVIHDFLNGIEIPAKMETPMAIVTKKNADLYLNNVTDKKLTKQNVKKINFNKYSKKYNGGKPYNFSLDSILEQL